MPTTTQATTLVLPETPTEVTETTETTEITETAATTKTVPTQRTLVPPSAETPTDRLTRRTLGALRRQGGRVLVTGRTAVPADVGQRLHQRDPALAGRATCEDIFALAGHVLAEREIDVCTDQHLVDAAWSEAWERVGRHTVLCGLDDDTRWRAEIAGAIKGRGLVRFSQYQDCADHLATAVWDLYVAYCEELTMRFAHDQADLIAITLDELTVNPPRNRYCVVVLDPTLPLTPTMVRMLRALTVTR
ncbi:MAG: hypothetical protein FWF02_05145 [Micrococcales bacterium]|nr:hypothetical protein [Micrococcales bacterium]MCL2667079.1 hypothetical protein [Micrococcales bacterium]